MEIIYIYKKSCQFKEKKFNSANIVFFAVYFTLFEDSNIVLTDFYFLNSLLMSFGKDA